MEASITAAVTKGMIPSMTMWGIALVSYWMR
jgi:hypothetical protein